jgi:hypothetical protein
MHQEKDTRYLSLLGFPYLLHSAIFNCILDTLTSSSIMSTEALIPDLVVPFEPRALLSLAGIVTLVLGVWYVDRTWDEEGSKAYARAAKESKSKKDIVIPQNELEKAFVFPAAFLAGWLMYAVSNVLAVTGLDLNISTSTGLAAGASLLLAWIASVPMEVAVRDRKADLKQKLGLSFVSSWILLTVATVQSSATAYAVYLNPAGMVCIVASMKILWVSP